MFVISRYFITMCTVLSILSRREERRCEIVV